VRFRRMRYLALFLAAMLIASNATAATRACVMLLAGHQPTAAHAIAAGTDDDTCSHCNGDVPCLKHYVQTYQNDAQKSFGGFPVVGPLTTQSAFKISTPAQPELVAAAPSPHFFGRSLTILFGHFRN
jgi:hypothetical protein